VPPSLPPLLTPSPTAPPSPHAGRDINLDINRVVGYRQFCNKLWNATRFALTHLSADRYTPAPLLDSIDALLASPHLAIRDRWILSRLNAAIVGTDQAMKDYVFGAATTVIYDFFLYELCDYYLELVKPVMNGDAAGAADAGGDIAEAQRLARTTLHLCLEFGFRLLHPMMPFVTEELWQRLPGRGKPLRSAAAGSPADWESIMVAPYPAPLPTASRPDIEAGFVLYQNVVRIGRSLRSDADIVPSKQVNIFIVAGDAATAATLRAQHLDLVTLLRASSLTIVDAPSAVPEGCSAAVVNEFCSIHLVLKGLIDPAVEIGKLEKKAEKVLRELDRLRRGTAVPNYEDKVPAEVRAQTAESITSAEQQLAVFRALTDKYREWAAAAAAAAATGPTGTA
jgi:valyl-tRNA synthetase